jgi:hypothetical protein
MQYTQHVNGATVKAIQDYRDEMRLETHAQAEIAEKQPKKRKCGETNA